MVSGKIYKIVNDVNDKVYVGQTIQTLEERFKKHCQSDGRRRKMAIKEAIRKYGKEHFKIELIEECPVEKMNEREIYWIAFYDSYHKGYNRTRGGQYEEANKKISKEDEKLIVQLYQEGHSSVEIANRFDVKKGTILKHLKRCDVITKDRLEGIVDIEEIKNYIRKNRPFVNEVTEKFNISRCSVYNIIKREKDPTLILESYHPRKSNADIHAREVCEKYNEGYNIQDLIIMFHSSKRYVSKVLKSRGIQIQRGRKSLIEYNNSTSVQTLS